MDYYETQSRITMIPVNNKMEERNQKFYTLKLTGF